ncbi:MAG: hypothetical protein AAF770_02745 [Bacteroidota bacterium]
MIKKELKQQEQIFTTRTPPRHSIVSFFQPYLRAIVRRKEVKKVEFDAKINKIQVDEINLIHCLSFDPFNEGRQFNNSIYQVQ